MQPLDPNTLFLKTIDALHENISRLNALVLYADSSMSRMIELCSNEVERNNMEQCRHEYLLYATQVIGKIDVNKGADASEEKKERHDSQAVAEELESKHQGGKNK
jgi:hypothetical protein